MGFVLTLDLVLYDLRNSGIYDGCIHRAKMLEGILREARYESSGGAYRQRLPSYYRLFWVPVKHDAALALAYGAALGAWMFPISKGGAILVGQFIKWEWESVGWSGSRGTATSAIALLTALASAFILFRSLTAADNPRAANALTTATETSDQWNIKVRNEARNGVNKKIVKDHWRPMQWAARVLLRGRHPEVDPKLRGQIGKKWDAIRRGATWVKTGSVASRPSGGEVLKERHKEEGGGRHPRDILPIVRDAPAGGPAVEDWRAFELQIERQLRGS